MRRAGRVTAIANTAAALARKRASVLLPQSLKRILGRILNRSARPLRRLDARGPAPAAASTSVERTLVRAHSGYYHNMAIGTSILLIAVGAVLRFAVSVTTSGFSIHTIGVILMIVGAVGLLLSLLWMTVWADRMNRPRGYADPRVPPTEPY